MFVITEKETDFVVCFANNIEIREENECIYNVDEDTLYYMQQYQYFEVATIPGGVTIEQYKYTPENGFTLQYSSQDMLNARMALINLDTRSEQTYQKFVEEKAEITEKLSQLKSDSLTKDDRLDLLEEIVCDLYDVLISLEG